MKPLDNKRRGWLDLSGTWFAIWQTTVERASNTNTEVIEARGHKHLRWRNVSSSLENQLAGFLWRADLRLRHDRFLIGTYRAAEKNMLYTGTLFYTLHRSGTYMCGRWVGCNYDDDLASGFSVVARDASLAETKFLQWSQQEDLHRRSGLPIDAREA